MKIGIRQNGFFLALTLSLVMVLTGCSGKKLDVKISDNRTVSMTIEVSGKSLDLEKEYENISNQLNALCKAAFSEESKTNYRTLSIETFFSIFLQLRKIIGAIESKSTLTVEGTCT